MMSTSTLKATALIALALLTLALVPAILRTNANQAEAASVMVICNRGSGTISLIDTKDDVVVATIPLPEGPFAPEPMYVVNPPPGDRVFVGDRRNSRVVVFRADDFSVETTIPTGNGLFHMETDEAGHQLWVVNDIDESATVIDPQTLEVIATVPMPADLVTDAGVPHDVIVDPDGLFAYITYTGTSDPTSDLVVMFETEFFTEVNRAQVGEFPHVIFNRKNDEVYVTCQNANVVQVLDAFDLSLQDAVPVPGTHGTWMSNDSKRFYTSNLPGGGKEAIWVIDTTTNERIGVADTPNTVPHNLGLSPNGKKLYVTHSGANNTVSVFRTTKDGDLAFLKSITVGNNPFGLGLARSGDDD
jgi:YVTN family beta-propeller protein